jgi:hypothetical protein
MYNIVATIYNYQWGAWQAARSRHEAEREALVGLLTVAKCPNCDGSGAIARETVIAVPGCCGRPLGSGECCGDPIPVPELSMELEQCQWCYERSVALGLLSDSGSQG